MHKSGDIVKIAVVESDIAPFASESVFAKVLDNGNYEIDNIPFFTNCFNWRDEVECKREDGITTFLSVSKASGNDTFRIKMTDVDNIDAFQNTKKVLTALNLVFESMSIKEIGQALITVNYTSNKDIDNVTEALAALEEDCFLSIVK